jgi:hypothetical protein
MSEETPRPAPNAADAPNISLTGDDARFLLSLIMAPEARIPGPYALRVGHIIKVLNELSEVQPPQRPQFPGM